MNDSEAPFLQIFAKSWELYKQHFLKIAAIAAPAMLLFCITQAVPIPGGPERFEPTSSIVMRGLASILCPLSIIAIIKCTEDITHGVSTSILKLYIFSLSRFFQVYFLILTLTIVPLVFFIIILLQLGTENLFMRLSVFGVALVLFTLLLNRLFFCFHAAILRGEFGLRGRNEAFQGMLYSWNLTKGRFLQTFKFLVTTFLLPVTLMLIIILPNLTRLLRAQNPELPLWHWVLFFFCGIFSTYFIIVITLLFLILDHDFFLEK